MPASDETKKKASKAKGWLNRIFPRKGKTAVNQGTLGTATKQIRGRRAKMQEMMKGL